MTAIADQPLDAPAAAWTGGLRVPVGIQGTGLYVPTEVVTNRDLVSTLDTTDEWIRAKTGIRERRYLAAGMQNSDMCVRAARAALADSGVRADEIDAIVVATFTQDQPLPSTALIVKDAIGAHSALPLDLNQAACAGGVYGILVGSHLLQSDSFRSVLVIGAEALSRVTDPRDRSTRVFFGDAAGAVVLGRTVSGFGVLSWDIGSTLSHSVEVPAGGTRAPASARTVADGGHYLKMDGRVVWTEATARLPRSIEAAVARAGLRVSEVDHFFLHQANLNIVREVMSVLDVPAERAPTSVQHLGNTGAATVFTVLDQAMRGGSVAAGEVLVVSAIGAGFLWGSLCLRHGPQVAPTYSEWGMT
ncbi:3-oxoacyl-ACP synthase III family protein [Actinokineospora sp.]|uniref:3-oxoacyl-ACP synthase III family protein n=1 Tax=Actinokineospora sp. TaxID=1872133 RepID=UPI00403804B9